MHGILLEYMLHLVGGGPPIHPPDVLLSLLHLLTELVLERGDLLLQSLYLLPVRPLTCLEAPLGLALSAPKSLRLHLGLGTVSGRQVYQSTVRGTW